MKIQGVHVFIGVVILAMVVTIVAAFFTVGSPKEERARRLDAQRISDLQQIANAIDVTWNTSKTLPGTLDELAVNRGAYVQSIQDPETQKMYEYLPSTSSAYELCATFTLPSSAQEQELYSPAQKPLSDRLWSHEAGRKCFTLTPVVYQK